MHIYIHKMQISSEIQIKELLLVTVRSFVCALLAEEHQCLMNFNQKLTRGMKSILCISLFSYV